MVANRQKVAQQLRSEGSESYQKAKAEADLEASKLLADATKQSKEIMGQADADALKIYADSYSKDPGFYGYWRSLQAMKSSLGHDATIILDRNSPLWKGLAGHDRRGENYGKIRGRLMERGGGQACPPFVDITRYRP